MSTHPHHSFFFFFAVPPGLITVNWIRNSTLPSAVEAWCPNYWITMEVPTNTIFIQHSIGPKVVKIFLKKTWTKKESESNIQDVLYSYSNEDMLLAAGRETDPVNRMAVPKQTYM